MFSDFNRVQSDKEGVKLLSVKTTSPETGECFLCVCHSPCLSPEKCSFGMSSPIAKPSSVLVRSKSPQKIPLQQKSPDWEPIELHCSCTLCGISIWEKYEWFRENNFLKSLMASDLLLGMFRSNSDHDIYQLDLAIQGSLKTGNIPGAKMFGSQCHM